MNNVTPSYQHFIGIDISKKDFVCAVYNNSNTETHMNNKDGQQKFVTKYCSTLDKSLVVMETTGGYEIDLLKHLLSNNITVHSADTRKVKNFICSWGKHGKTDKIDAQAIALYAQERYKHLKIYKETKMS